MAVLAGLSPAVAQAESDATRRISICMHREGNMTGVILALMTVSRLFREIGVTLIWTTPGSCPSDGIRISLTRNTPVSFQPGAMAYALPFEGAQIRVFVDRIEKNSPSLVPHLLGYVIAHEITHIIQGTDHHSDHGVMKAHWDGRDLNQMQWDQLSFAREDVDLILMGLNKRTQGSWSPANVSVIPPPR